MQPSALPAPTRFRESLQQLLPVDAFLLLLLLGITQNLLWIKMATVCLALVIYIFRRGLKIKSLPGPFLFYLIMPVLGTFAAWLNGAFQFTSYPYVLAYGTLQWLVAGVGFLLLYAWLQQANAIAARNSLRLFVLLNFLASLAYLLVAMKESGSWWPYALQHQENFGLSTGDYIRGIFGGASLVNAACSALLLLYFSGKKEFSRAALCLVPLWLCGSNLFLLITVLFLGLQLFIYEQQRGRRLVFLLIVAAGYMLTNFSNISYLLHMSRDMATGASEESASTADDRAKDKATGAGWLTDKPANALTKTATVQQRQLAASLLPLLAEAPAGTHGEANGPSPDMLRVRQIVSVLYGCDYRALPAANAHLPLKAFALLQTIQYSLRHPKDLWLGAGMGNASSKLAMKVTGAGWHGSWPVEKAYVGAAFYSTHLPDFLYLFSQDVSQHSIAHFPNNAYTQLLGEYGILGVFLFLLLYVKYFLKIARTQRSHAWPLLLLLLLVLGTDYWLESITITFVFETLLLLPQAADKPEATT